MKNDSMIDRRFGIMRMEGEELIFAAKPSGFVRFHIISGCLAIVGIVLIPIVWLWAKVAEPKYRYWLTNRRVILSSGFIGYRVRSIPLERISDVALSNTFPEMLSNVSSIVVRDMTGETDSGKSLLAIDNAAEYQRQILEAVEKVNRKRQAA